MSWTFGRIACAVAVSLRVCCALAFERAFTVERCDGRPFRIHGSYDETKQTYAMMQELAAEVKRVTGTVVRVLPYAPAFAGDFFVSTQPWEAKGAWRIVVRNGIVGIHGSDPEGTEAALRRFIDVQLKSVASSTGRLEWPEGILETSGAQAEDVREETLARIRAERVNARAPEWANEFVNFVGTEPARAYSFPLASVRDALTDEIPQTPFVRPLDGLWRYKWSARPGARPKDFWRMDFDDAEWGTIDVPSCVEVKGHGKPIYTNIRYPHAETPPDVGVADNPVSSYRRNFDIPTEWEGRNVYLRFEGVYSAYYVWVNGQKVGYSEDSCTAHEFNITPYVKKEGNLLCVEVYRWCDGSFLEDQDFFRYSGIYRSVMLFAAPKTEIRDFHLKYDLSDDYHSVKMELATELRGPSVPVRAALYDADYNKVCDTERGMNLQAPRLWTAETPCLYTLVIEAGEDIRSCKVGFMKSEIADNGSIRINGRPVKFKGVNRHDASAVNGRSVTRDEMLWDVLTMKRNNINTVRTAHYPNDPYFYHLCERYGLYVQAEANVESHGMGYGVKSLASPPSWTQSHVERCRDMVINWRNSPCIFSWSWGNEAGQGPTFDIVDATCRKLDDSRPTCYRQDCERFSIDGPGYPSVGEIRQRGRRDKCSFLFEYAHAMGNALGNFDQYWDAIYESPSLTGGCIWDWIDQALWRDDGRGGKFLAYGGDFGDEPNDGNFCVNGLVTADRKDSPKLREVGYVHRNLVMSRKTDGSFELWNRFGFTHADDFAGKWRLRENGVAVAEGNFVVPSVAPLTRRAFRIPALEYRLGSMDHSKDCDVDFEFSLKEDRLWAAKGHVIAEDQIRIRKAERVGSVFEVRRVPIRATETSVIFETRGTRAVFDRRTGFLEELKIGGAEILAKGCDGIFGPHLTCARALTDNDAWMRKEFEKSGLAHLRYDLVSFVVTNDSVVVRQKVEGASGEGFVHRAVWHMDELGTLTVENEVSPLSHVKRVIPRLGLSLVLAPGLENVRWYGRGPHENYVDRRSSAFRGVWASTVADQYVPYCRPQDSGYKTDVQWVSFSAEDGVGVLIASDDPFCFQSLHHTVDDLNGARHRAGEAPRCVPLPERREIYLNLDWKQLGLGEASCGPKPEQSFIPTIDASRFTMRFAPLKCH